MSQKLLFGYWSCPKLKSLSRRLAFIPALFCIYGSQWWLCFLTVHTQRTRTEQLKESHPSVFTSPDTWTLGKEKLKSALFRDAQLRCFQYYDPDANTPVSKRPVQEWRCDCLLSAVQRYRARLVIVLRAPPPLWSVLWLPGCQQAGSAELEASCCWALCHSERMLWNGQQSLLMGSQHTDLPRLCWALTA